MNTQEANDRLRECRTELVEFARSLVGKPYSRIEFNCLDFIKTCYSEFGIILPRIENVVLIADFDDPDAIGMVVYLKRRNKKSGCKVSHFAIYLGGGEVIHNSYYFGKKVTVTPLTELWEIYRIVE